MSGKRSKNFNKLIDHFISTSEQGHYDAENFSICLYGIKNDPVVLKKIFFEITKVTTKFKFIILDTEADFTNINILDIDL